MIRPGKFSIDDSPVFPGFTGGDTWNGFATPAFTKEQAEPVLKEFHGDKLTLQKFLIRKERLKHTHPYDKNFPTCWTYNPQKDAFFIYDSNHEGEGDDGITEVYGMDCELSTGEKIRIYDVTSCYCWMEEEAELRKMLVMVTLTPCKHPGYNYPFKRIKAREMITETRREIRVFTLNNYEKAQQDLPEYAGRRDAKYEITVLADNLTDEEIGELRKSITKE